MPAARAFLSAAVISDSVWAMGGTDAFQTPYANVYSFDSRTGHWRIEQGMIERVGGHTVVGRLSNYVYVAGDNVLQSFSHRAKTWTRAKATMCQARTGFAMAALGNHMIYAIGGQSAADGQFLSSVEKFSSLRQQWSLVAPMTHAREDACTAVLDGKLYVIGGSRDTVAGAVRTVEMYDPSKDAWTEIAPMTVARSAACAVVGEDNLIYVFGGENDASGCERSMEVYDPVADRWTLLPESEWMHEERKGFGAVIL